MKKIILTLVVALVLFFVTGNPRSLANQNNLTANTLETDNNVFKELTDILIGISERLNTEEPVSAGPLYFFTSSQ